MTARHLTAEGKAARKRKVLSIAAITLACCLLVGGTTIAVMRHESAVEEARCSQGASTPVEAVTDLLAAVDKGDWVEACKYTDSSAAETEKTMSSMPGDHSEPMLSPTPSSVDGWVAVSYESTTGDGVETQVWCKQAPDGRWVVSMDGE